MKALGSLLVTLGLLLLLPAFVLWRDGSSIGVVLAWIAGMWGFLLLGWGALCGWWKTLPGCLLGSVSAIASVGLALAWSWQEGEWISPLTLPCQLGGGVCLALGFLSLRRRLNADSEAGQ